jgi:hypothetical protein
VDRTFRIDQLYQAAARAHFEKFDPLTAARNLIQLIGHPETRQSPADWFLQRLMMSLSIFRQSRYVVEAVFCAAGDRCLERLNCLSNSDKGERLAGLACAVAWEMAALVVQRGGASAGVPVLDQIDSTIERLRLVDALPRGKFWTMAKMQHWGRDIAMEKIDSAAPGMRPIGTRIDALAELEPPHPAELFNVNIQKFVELLRYVQTNNLSAERRLENFFDLQFGPDFVRLTDVIAKQGIVGMNEIITPATAYGVALHTSIFANHFDRHVSGDLIDRAKLLFDAVYTASHGSVILQPTNSQTIAAARRLSSGKWRCQIPAFQFVADLNEPTRRILLDYASRILALVDGCLIRGVAV